MIKVSKLATVIGKKEGWGIPGNQPTRKNNPGDLRHSPHSSHIGEGPDDIGEIDTPEHGWEDLQRQLTIYAAHGMTIRSMVYEYAPESENDSEAYLDFVCKEMGCSPDSLVSDMLKIGGGDVA